MDGTPRTLPASRARPAPEVSTVPDFETLFAGGGGDFFGDDRLLLVFLVADLGREAAIRDVKRACFGQLTPAEVDARAAELVAVGAFQHLEVDGVAGWRITTAAAVYFADLLFHRCPREQWPLLPPWLHSMVRAI